MKCLRKITWKLERKEDNDMEKFVKNMLKDVCQVEKERIKLAEEEEDNFDDEKEAL